MESQSVSTAPRTIGRPTFTTRPKQVARLLGVTAISSTAILLLLNWAITLMQRGLSMAAVGGDFGPTLVGARIIRDGHGDHLYDPATQLATQAQVLAPYMTRAELLPYNHPPAEALAIVPLMGLPYALIYVVWTLAGVLAVSLAVWLLASLLPLPPARRWFLLGAIASYPFLYSALWLGQNTPFVLLGVCGLFVGSLRRRAGWAGVSLALIALKPQLLPIFLLLLVLQRRWRTLAIGLGTLGIASVVTMPWLGVAWPLRYARFLDEIAHWPQGEIIDASIMLNWRGLAANLAGAAPRLAMLLEIGFTGASVGWLCWCWWRARHDQHDELLLWGLAIVVALLVGPHVNPHELTLLIVPAWIVVARAPAAGPSRLWLVLLWGTYGLRWLTLLPGYPAVAVIPSVVLL
ncbi:MAG: glycosyltransferase family 87 protein, partial [Thermomicrobiales bacterium]